MRVLVCGSRNWTDEYRVRRRLMQLPADTQIIHGGCRGADSIADSVAKEARLPVIEVPADWDRYGASAGPIRNRQMLDMGPKLVLAFHDDIKKSKGTIHTLTLAEQRGIVTELIGE